ncbi:pyruvate dehydrogenase E1 component beta subunit [Salsuginibacillus halophilus]|uniref:Pyruvate dehydrogenase E1 component beta subunit n=1 Tax=Salsuginibacillus halophilus TaxID=517424 RepID=A0A2P8HQJ2_9BACI|nr:alpha-ketoacid dehydrogenase subunit beta [Salsuginibacillus halophilus]PSL48462.1 pyruvate dehydrogenase E1 component beta subunit [Salsuginibacillus halophilus]
MSVAVETKKLTMIQGINDALSTALNEDERTLILGEDVGVNGGVFRATEGLQEKYGSGRVIDTPLAESGIMGTSIGLAANGFRPIAEMQFLGFVYPAFNQIMTHATRLRQRTLGRYTSPLVIRAPYGAGVRAPEIHSDSVEALFTHMPGIKVVVPSNAYDAKGLLLESIADPDPVIFLEPMRCYRSSKTEVPEEKYKIELGKAATLKEGEDVSIFTWGAMTIETMKAVEQLEAEKEISCEVIDLRTLYPLDRDAIAASVQKTTRAVVVQEAPLTGGVSSEVLSVIQDTSFLYLRSPVKQVGGLDVPVPVYSLENEYLPSVDKIKYAVEQTVSF